MDNQQAISVLNDYVISLSADIMGLTEQAANQQKKLDAANIALSLLQGIYKSDQSKIDTLEAQLATLQP